MEKSNSSILSKPTESAKRFIISSIGSAKIKVGESLKQHADSAKEKISSKIEDITESAIEKADTYVRRNIEKKLNRIADTDNNGVSQFSNFPVPIKSTTDEKQTTLETDDHFNDEDKFVDNIANRIYEFKDSPLKNSPAEIVDVLNKITGIVSDVEKFREVQITKRTIIEANKDIIITKINAQKEMLLLHLERTFDERKDTFSKYFDIIDDALAKDNIQQLSIGLNCVVELSKTSPFKDLADIGQIGTALQDKDHEWDF